MKRSMRLLACLLCFVTLFMLASCAIQTEDGVPEGMLSATCVDAKYRLYVPTHWTPQTSYGVSGAYRTFSNQSTVSVSYYPMNDVLLGQMKEDLAASGKDPQDSTARIQWFAEKQCQESVRARTLNGEITLVEEDCIATELGGLNAYQYHYTALINGNTVHFLQRITRRFGNFYVFTFTATADMYEMCLSDVNTILDYFEFSDTPYVPENYAKELSQKVTPPEGMQIASGDDVAYRFFVPADWKINMDQSIYAAYVESDRTSVSVVPYQPAQDSMRVSEYFTMTRDMLINLSGEGGFEMISDSENPQKQNLGGREASIYEYRLTVGGVTYRYRQYVCAYRSMIYSVTYTATEEAYAAHLSDLEAIVNAFVFR